MHVCLLRNFNFFREMFISCPDAKAEEWNQNILQQNDGMD